MHTRNMSTVMTESKVLGPQSLMNISVGFLPKELKGIVLPAG